jgi:hypothetical protein
LDLPPSSILVLVFTGSTRLPLAPPLVMHVLRHPHLQPASSPIQHWPRHPVGALSLVPHSSSPPERVVHERTSSLSSSTCTRSPSLVPRRARWRNFAPFAHVSNCNSV